MTPSQTGAGCLPRPASPTTSRCPHGSKPTTRWPTPFRHIKRFTWMDCTGTQERSICVLLNLECNSAVDAALWNGPGLIWID